MNISARWIEGLRKLASDPIAYAVKPGDSLDRLAVGFDNRRDEIKGLNPKINFSKLHPGVKLQIPADPSYNPGSYSPSQTSNLVQRLLYAEAGGENPAVRTNCMNGVASTVLNRSRGDLNRFAPEILRQKQYSCFNGLTNGVERTPQGFVERVPELKNEADRRAWADAGSVMRNLMSGTFKSTIGNRNTYVNEGLERPGWLARLKDPMTLGSQTFGSLPENDGRRGGLRRRQALASIARKSPEQIAESARSSYQVRPGDSLWSIESHLGVPHGTLRRMNPSVNPLRLAPGTELQLQPEA